ncbi:MAG: hypothetical protein AAFO77_10060 [Pseudomonadota bacterium]
MTSPYPKVVKGTSENQTDRQFLGIAFKDIRPRLNSTLRPKE